MYKVSLKINGENITAKMYDSSTDVISFHPVTISMTIQEMKALRLWLNGMIDLVAPFECTIGGKEYYLNYEAWFPLREAINKWYEANHAPI